MQIFVLISFPTGSQAGIMNLPGCGQCHCLQSEIMLVYTGKGLEWETQKNLQKRLALRTLI